MAISCWRFECLYTSEGSDKPIYYTVNVEACNYLEGSKAFMMELLLDRLDFVDLLQVKGSVLDDHTKQDN